MIRVTRKSIMVTMVATGIAVVQFAFVNCGTSAGNPKNQSSRSAGDFNADGKVNEVDLAHMNICLQPMQQFCENADLDESGTVDSTDSDIFFESFEASSTPIIDGDFDNDGLVNEDDLVFYFSCRRNYRDECAKVDLDGNGAIEYADRNIMFANFTPKTVGTGIYRSDFNGDRSVNETDYYVFAACFSEFTSDPDFRAYCVSRADYDRNGFVIASDFNYFRSDYNACQESALCRVD